MNDTDPRTDEWLTPREAAALLGIKPDTIRRWANDGVLPAQRVRRGSHRRFRRSDVIALLETANPPAEQEHSVREPVARAS